MENVSSSNKSVKISQHFRKLRMKACYFFFIALKYIIEKNNLENNNNNKIYNKNNKNNNKEVREKRSFFRDQREIKRLIARMIENSDVSFLFDDIPFLHVSKVPRKLNERNEIIVLPFTTCEK